MTPSRSFLPVLTWFFVAVLCLVSTEVAIRLYKLAIDPAFLEFQKISYLRPSDIPGVVWEPIPNKMHIGQAPYNQGVQVWINGCAFRGTDSDCDFYRQGGDKDIFTVVGIGDSYTAGASLPEDQVFGKRLQAFLNQAGIKALYLNFGQGSFNARQEEALLGHVLKSLRADAVVWQFLLNDHLPEHRMTRDWINQFGGGPVLRWLKENSYVVRGVSYLLTWNDKVPMFPSHENLKSFIIDGISSSEGWKQIEEPICRAAKAVQQAGAKGVFLYPVYQEMLRNWEEYDQQLLDLDMRILSMAQDCGWDSVVYMYPVLSQQPFDSLVLDINLDHHPNKLGNELIARELLKTVRPLAGN